MSAEPSEATAPSGGEPRFLRMRSWAIGLVVSMVLTCMFVQFVNDWIDHDLATLDVERTHQPVSDTEIFQNHAHLVMWTRVAVIVFAISAFLWLVWQYQAHANARALGRRGRRSLPPVLGLLAWVVPVANVVLVPLAMGSLFLASDPEQGTSNRGPRTYVLLVLVWWGLFVTGAWMIGSAVLSLPAHASFTQLIDRDTRVRAGSYFLFFSAAAAAAVVAAIDVRLQAKDARVSFERERRGWTNYEGRAAKGNR